MRSVTEFGQFHGRGAVYVEKTAVVTLVRPNHIVLFLLTYPCLSGFSGIPSCGVGWFDKEKNVRVE